MHHGATGELIEDAIRLLSLLETFSDVDDEIPVTVRPSPRRLASRGPPKRAARPRPHFAPALRGDPPKRGFVPTGWTILRGVVMRRLYTDLRQTLASQGCCARGKLSGR